MAVFLKCQINDTTKQKLFILNHNIKNKMGDNKISMPSSTAGITRFFDEYKSKITVKPTVIIIMTVLVVIIEIILYIYGYQILGLE